MALHSDSKAPRYRRIGGYVMTHKTAESGRRVFSGNRRIKQYSARVRRYRTHCMVVTQAAWFRGYVGMPAEKIPVSAQMSKRRVS